MADIIGGSGFDERDEYESPIFIFPDDEDSGGAKASAADNNESEDDSSTRLTFGRVSAAKKEKEFVFMPFLDDKPTADDDGEVSSLSFSKVKAAKKESEFIFMPFLNISDEAESDDDGFGSSHHQIRPDGTVFDEGLILMPLAPLNEYEEEEGSGHDSDADDVDDDTGIYVTDAGSGGYAPVTHYPPKSRTKTGSTASKSKSKSKTNSKNAKNSKKKRPPQGGKSRSGPTAEEQFRTAMMNLDPEIRRAAMRDPIQRAALEQAVRIALVQQAAQEAVARTTGAAPGIYASYMINNPPAAANSKRGQHQQAPHRNTPASPASGVKGFQFAGFDSSPADFTVGTPEPLQQQAPVAAAPAPVPTPAPVPEQRSGGDSIDFASTIPVPSTPVPDASQDSIISSLSGSSAAGRPAPSTQQDPALATLTRSGSKSHNYTSPAAIRAAMRAGVDVSTLASETSSASQGASAAQKIKLQDAVDTKKSGCLIWIIVLFFIFFIGLIAVAVWPSLKTELRYQDAASVMAQGDFLTASEQFAELGDYKDSVSKSHEAIYNYATLLENNGDYEQAIKYFSGITTYSSASERLAECRYALGKQYMQAENFEAAYEQLYQIPKYSDAGELAMLSNYNCAVGLYNEDNFEAAAVRFSMFLDYLDSYSLWQICQYNTANKLLEADDRINAYSIFMEIGDYEDAALQAALIQYQLLTADTPVPMPIDEVMTCLNTLSRNSGNQQIAGIIRNPVYHLAKLVGYWSSEEGNDRFSVSVTDGITEFLSYIGKEEANSSDAQFVGNTLYSVHDGAYGAPLIRIIEFSPELSAHPDTITFFSYAAEDEYTLYRAG